MRVEWWDALDWKVALDGAIHHQELNEAGDTADPLIPRDQTPYSSSRKSTRTERHSLVPVKPKHPK